MQRDSSEVRAVRHTLPQEVTAGYDKLDNNPVSKKQMSFYCVSCSQRSMGDAE